MGILSRFGIGSATVDLMVPETVGQGERVEATVAIEGGDDTQQVENVYALLRCETDDDSTWTMAEFTLVEDGFTIEPDTSREFDVTLAIPELCPPTTTSIEAPDVWIDTGLDVELAVDPDDRDALDVEPGGRFGVVHEALTDHLPFRVGPTDVVAAGGGYASQVEYVPEAGDSDLQEMELVFLDADSTGLHLRSDCDAAERSMFGDVEERRELTVTSTDPAEVAAQFRSMLDELF
jgi:sporulation-control protein